MGWTWPDPAPTSSTWAESRPVREPDASPQPRSSPGSFRSSANWLTPVFWVSIDTTRAHVALAALSAGAAAVNDVSGGLADPAMARQVADAAVPFIAMHWRGHSKRMAAEAAYGDVVADVISELGRRMDALLEVGIQADRIILDPGIGFAKRPVHDWELLSRLGELLVLGQPILLGASRKSFLGAVSGVGEQATSPPERDPATAAVSALAAAAGAFCVRVHDVPASLDAVRVAAAWTASRAGTGHGC